MLQLHSGQKTKKIEKQDTWLKKIEIAGYMLCSSCNVYISRKYSYILLLYKMLLVHKQDDIYLASFHLFVYGVGRKFRLWQISV